MKNATIGKEEFRYALTEFGKGEIFEEFALSFLSHVLADEFIPVGGTKDKGIDASMRIFTRNTHSKFIYQISTELSYEQKINDTIATLNKNDIYVDKLIYVTGRKLNQKDRVEDSFLADYKIPLTIYDVEWFASHVIDDERLIRLYHTFIESNIHVFRKPDKHYVAGNFIKDPRLFVFMRQQFDSTQSSQEIENKLADTLILFGLEGTAAEKEIFKTVDTIKVDISKYIKFNPKSIYETIDNRLKVLSSTKPYQVHYHKKEDAYCLPYKTRLKLQERDVIETKIFNMFQEQTKELLAKYLHKEGVKAKKVLELIESTIHKIYHKQGLEFASFVIDGESKDILEDALPDIVAEVVDDSHIIIENKEKVKRALLMTIRHLSYNGTREQKEYLRRLSNTYNMMFLLKWDSQLAAGFQTLASKLKIYVGTSILIPALSEIYLEKNKRRYWNLLEGAHLAGVQLTINETILEELANHFGMIRSNYQCHYQDVEEFYLEDEFRTIYIDEILIRAYFYSKSRGTVNIFNDFIRNFAHPNLVNVKRDLKGFLSDEFFIEYEDTKSIETKIDNDELSKLTEKLTEIKQSEKKAKNDAKLMLMVYKQRELNNEEDGKAIFGYKTWWLSKDIYTYRAIKGLFRSKYNVNCYMRSDFLYNYISLAPKKKEIDNMFKEIFPSMLGISLSYHLPKSICNHINKSINEHATSSPTMIKRALRNYTEQLMSKPTKNSKKLTSYFDDEVKKAKSALKST
ncbi:MAG: hypothetical protein KAR19_20010 [Bacteroidales bacterium]|nr:hypothetical protein [Bacteroidales bacterium]